MFLLILTCIYALVLLWFTWQWARIRECKNIIDKSEGCLQKSFAPPVVTILVAARNEEKNLPALFASLGNQTYPGNELEILVIDDYSTDNTAKVTIDFKKSLSNLALISLSELPLYAKEKNTLPIAGKKSAIEYGLTCAKGEWILITDADCKMGSEWVSSMIFKMVSEDLNFLAGPVKGEKKHTSGFMFFHSLSHLEFLGLIGMGACGLKGGVPLMCNAANMGFRKSAFFSCGGFGKSRSAASGDDEFLLKNMVYLDLQKVKFFKDKQAIVTTVLPVTLSEILAQRIRWASKVFKEKSPGSMLFVIFISLFFATIGWQWLMIFTGKILLKLFLLHFFIKLFAEFVFLYPILSWFNRKRLLLGLIPLQIMYPFYIIVVGLASRFPVYKWKGRWVR